MYKKMYKEVMPLSILLIIIYGWYLLLKVLGGATH